MRQSFIGELPTRGVQAQRVHPPSITCSASACVRSNVMPRAIGSFSKRINTSSGPATARECSQPATTPSPFSSLARARYSPGEQRGEIDVKGVLLTRTERPPGRLEHPPLGIRQFPLRDSWQPADPAGLPPFEGQVILAAQVR